VPLYTAFGWLTELVSGEWWTYLLVFGVALADAVLPFVPSETVVILAGIAAAAGGLHLWLVILGAWAGVVIGDNLSYLLGAKVGEPAYQRLFSGEQGKKHYDWAHGVLQGHGAWIVPTARFVPGGRTAVTFSAGTVSMRWRRFFLADLGAGLIWATYSGLLGYLGGRTFESSSWKSYAMAFGIAGLIAPAGIAYWRVAAPRS
jgi:membrane protein DedA with SNARE-associated domain